VGVQGFPRNGRKEGMVQERAGRLGASLFSYGASGGVVMSRLPPKKQGGGRKRKNSLSLQKLEGGNEKKGKRPCLGSRKKRLVRPKGIGGRLSPYSQEEKLLWEGRRG